MHIAVLTLFPRMFDAVLKESILKLAIERKLVTVELFDLRDWGLGPKASASKKTVRNGPAPTMKAGKPGPAVPAQALGRVAPAGEATPRNATGEMDSTPKNKADLGAQALGRRTVDDRPYGGGAGMVLRPEPVFAAVGHITAGDAGWHLVLLTPQGRKYSQSITSELAAKEKLLLICGHYEGFDERIRTGLPVDEISVGDYVTTGGEIPAMIIIDTVAREIPGVLGNENSTAEESFSEGVIEYPQYTRPPEFRGMKVPDVLLSGHHGEIAKWRKEQALERTRKRRPDLLRE